MISDDRLKQIQTTYGHRIGYVRELLSEITSLRKIAEATDF